jgi:hypothetical protein
MKFKQSFLSLLRHLLTAAGAAVVAKNASNHPELSIADPSIIAGVIVTGIGTLWGVRDEHSAENK